MKWIVSSAWCVLLLLLLSLQQGSSDSCSAGIERLISGQRYRVHDQFFSSDLPSPPESRLDGSPWCTEMPPQRPWLQVEFGYDVTIHTLQTAGASRGLVFTDDFYVIGFQVQIGNSSDELQTILEPNSAVPMVFFRSSTPDTVSTDFPSPVTTRVLCMVMLNWTRDELCIDVEALGCLAEPLCAGDSQLTESRQLLSLSSITASSETSGDPVEDLVDRSFFFPSAWCSTQAFSEAPYVQLNFSSDVTLSYMVARGDISGFSYVTEFQLEIFNERSGNFTQYGVTDEPTVFTTSSADLMHYTFWRPAQGSLFRFIITDGVTNEAPIFGPGDFCWNIILHGCLLNGTPPFTAPPTPMATTVPIVSTVPATSEDANSRMTTIPTTSEDTNSRITTVPTRSSAITTIVVAVAVVSLVLILLFAITALCVVKAKSKRQFQAKPAKEDKEPYYYDCAEKNVVEASEVGTSGHNVGVDRNISYGMAKNMVPADAGRCGVGIDVSLVPNTAYGTQLQVKDNEEPNYDYIIDNKAAETLKVGMESHIACIINGHGESGAQRGSGDTSVDMVQNSAYGTTDDSTTKNIGMGRACGTTDDNSRHFMVQNEAYGTAEKTNWKTGVGSGCAAASVEQNVHNKATPANQVRVDVGM